MTVRTQNQGLWFYIICTWLLSGTVDLACAAIINPSVPVSKILRYIASGVFGEDAAATPHMEVYGLLLHYLIAFLFTVAFFKLYSLLRKMLTYQLAIALVIGLAVWCIMNLIVVPLSNTPKFPLTLAGSLKNIGALILSFGIPIPFIAERYFRND